MPCVKSLHLVFVTHSPPERLGVIGELMSKLNPSTLQYKEEEEEEEGEGEEGEGEEEEEREWEEEAGEKEDDFSTVLSTDLL